MAQINQNQKHIVIIGNGISGITCARHIRKQDSDIRITIISGETEHFYSRTALMYIYMGHMKYHHTKPYEDHFWGKNRLNLVHDWVTEIDIDNKKLNLEQSPPIEYDLLVLALGSKYNTFGWEGKDLKGVQGLYNYQDLEDMEANTRNCQRAVIVGGGLIGIEMAEMLRSRHIPVTFLVREKEFWNNILPEDEARLVGRHIREHHIDLRLETVLDKIIDDGNGKVKAVITQSGEVIPCQFVGLGVGVSPNISLIQDTPIEVDRGILVDEYFATNIEGVYAIGDCVQYRNPPPSRPKVEQVWYTGRMHGETLAYNLTHKPVPYQPGPWFNSAKFLDIEYQTYGVVPCVWKHPLDSFYWEHPEGKICFRALYDGNSRQLKGVNSMGFRLRHEYFDVLLKRGGTIEEVISSLHEASFDQEFAEDHHQHILHAFESQTGIKLYPIKKKRKGLLALFGL
ncbi:NAD(P)/FAD-dependent oxidoreductase [Anditalea andensis]|uniref:NADH dehydrogenase n=1 Tax=Anditalea andensis TaxID=1048983 RepID=A0A074KVW6_9BACT|nr:FAD/NAD(P)-binding oxidoreductase [Anditalea andensis]KEO74096.1 NADH dehydrogenase [Anditalea andensis]